MQFQQGEIYFRKILQVHFKIFFSFLYSSSNPLDSLQHPSLV